MPIYEYKCNDCTTVFEKMTTIDKKDTTACLSCGSDATSRLISRFGVAKSENTSSECQMPEPPPTCGAGACPSCM